MSEKVIVTGAAGFTGAILVEQLRQRGVEVYALVRPHSPHNKRLNRGDEGLHVIELDMDNIVQVKEQIPEWVSVFYHLAVTGNKDFSSQYVNVQHTLNALEVAADLGCKRFVGIGSQAEYGVVPPNELTTEDRMPNPFNAYGAAKVASCYLSKRLAAEKGIEWIWGRIFSVIGKYEPKGRMFPDLYWSLKRGETFSLSSCRQNWDYLDVYDAADAILAIGEKGVPGEIYNIANGDYKSLREFTEELREMINASVEIQYGDDPNPFVSLQPSVEKIRKDTGWMAKRGLEDSVKGWEYQE